MKTNPQSGSASSSSGGDEARSRPHKALPKLFWYMETGDWAKATDRAISHPKEVKTWATLRTKSFAPAGASKISGTKRLALHHACFKLRTAVSCYGSTGSGGSIEDPFVEVCRFILLLVKLYPEAAGMRESRHGCLPLHLASFASCTRPSSSSTPKKERGCNKSSSSSFSNPQRGDTSGIPRPNCVTSRSASESTSGSAHTNISAMLAEENYTGCQTMQQSVVLGDELPSPCSTDPGSECSRFPSPGVSLSIGPNLLVSEKREEMAVHVLNALLDAFPKGIRMDSEGGRLPLHTACAGRATPRVVTTLIRAYPSASRHRNKDGFLPLHLAAHWGISHPNVAISLLKSYPDATVGRNRWERTPLEEALSMAGENGRPHQAALVRALRKHPSYWARAELIVATSPRGEGNQIVDIDETIPSNEDESEEDEGHDHQFLGLLQTEDEVTNRRGRFNLIRKGRKEEGAEALSPVAVDLSTMIRNQDWQAVLARLECNPSEAEEELRVTTRGGFVSSTGFMALHYACERRPPLDVVEALIEAWPEAVATRAIPGGCLPLHIACTWYAPADVISSLLKTDRTTCKVQDELGNIPLHSSVFSGASTDVVDSLLRSYPKSVLSRNHQGSLAEDIVSRLRHDNRQQVLPLLIRFKDEILAKKGRDETINAPGRESQLDDFGARDGPPATPKVTSDSFDGALLQASLPGTEDKKELIWI